MSFISLFQTTSMAMLEILLLGACGFFLIKKKIINEEGLRLLSKLVIELFLPVFIFSQFMQNFSFSLFSNWLFFPFLCIAISLVGLVIGIIFIKIFRVSKDRHEKRQLLSLLMFQNSGYLPLILSATLLPQDIAGGMFIYIFLFLLGFNLTIWSFGVWFLRGKSLKQFELGSLFSPPVLAILISLVIVFLRIDRIMPQVIINVSEMLGRCTLPLAMIVVGGNLAIIPITKEINKRAVTMVLLVKLFILPLLALLTLLYFKISGPIGFLLILEAAVPCATSLSLITRHYQLEDKLINQGIFFTHILSLITIPIFLSIYWMVAF